MPAPPAPARPLQWTDPPEYLAAVDAYIAPLRGGPFWEGLRLAYTDLTRFRDFAARLAQYTPLRGQRLLDSGCGAAGLALTLHQAGAAEVVGIELDPAVARLAELRTGHLPNLRIVCDNAELLALEPASFDAIFSVHVIEHVEDVTSYLRTQAELLKPGGLLLVACPNQLWPVEAHSRLPLLNWLPRGLAKRLGGWIEQQGWLPQPLRDRGRTAVLYETDFTPWGLVRRLREQNLEIIHVQARASALRLSRQVLVIARRPGGAEPLAYDPHRAVYNPFDPTPTPEPMPWTDTPEYLAAVERHIAPLLSGPFGAGMRWACLDIDRFKGFTAIMARYLALAGQRLLDSGCGAAGLTLNLYQAGAAEVVGIELDPAFARLAEMRTAHLPNVRIICDDAALLALDPGSFDGIFSLHVIEHVLDVPGYVRTQFELLKPGGVLLLACPNRLWPQEAHSRLPFIHFLPRGLSKRVGGWIEQQGWLPQPVRDRGRTAKLYETDFTPWSLVRRLRQHGFEILHVQARDSALRLSEQIIVVGRRPA